MTNSIFLVCDRITKVKFQLLHRELINGNLRQMWK